jgi:uncharacterized protein YqeY
MTLKETLQDDLKNAMRSGDVMRRSVIRMLRSEIHNREIESRSELDDAATIQLLGRQAQQRRDSIEAFEHAERDDLVQKERAELAVIMGYLPQQLTGDELLEIVRGSIEQVGAAGPQDMGKVMGAVMPKVRGRAEGREVNRIASELLRGQSG